MRNSRQGLSERQDANFREREDASLPLRRTHILKADAFSVAAARSLRVFGAPGEEVRERPILIPQRLGEAGRGHLLQPFVPWRSLPAREHVADISTRELELKVLIGARP